MQTPSPDASRPAVPAVAAVDAPSPTVGSDGHLILFATSDDTVYVFADRELARLQYFVCIGANLDVEVLRVSPTVWAVAEHGLRAANPHAGTELAARYDYALVRLAERQAALILVAEALKEGR